MCGLGWAGSCRVLAGSDALKLWAPCSGVRSLRRQGPHVVDGLEKPPLFSSLSFPSSLPSTQPFLPVTLFTPTCFAWGQF